MKKNIKTMKFIHLYFERLIIFAFQTLNTMKPKIFLLVFILLSGFCLLGQNNIEEKVIVNAQRFLQKRDGNLKSAKQLVLTKFLENKTNKNQLFIHNIGEKQGWIITEKLGNELFVLGYSLTGSFNYEKCVPYVKNWLSVNLDSVSARNSAKIIQNSTQEYYQMEPFLKTEKGELIQWNQMPYYNQKCPVIDTVRTPIGCSATAFGQVMRFWEFPFKSRGGVDYHYRLVDRDSLNISLKHSFGDRVYNWKKMPSFLNSTSTGEEIEEISELLYDIGLSFKTIYMPEGSGAIDITGISRYFNYKLPTEIRIVENGNEVLTGADSMAFHNQIIANLGKGYPVVVIGYANAAFHAMVCDGYDNEGYYHLNYGWGGQSDGYYHFTNSGWCADLLFTSAYVDIVPSEMKYSYSVVDYNAIVKSKQMGKLVLQIEENDRSFPFYLKPFLKLKKLNGSIISPDFSYSFDSTKATVQINFQSPDIEGVYDLVVNFNMGKDTIALANLSLTVDDDYENISQDIQIVSINSINDYKYNSPTIELNIETQNKSIVSTCSVKSEIFSDQGVVEQTVVKNFNLSGNTTQLKIEFPLQDVTFGNKQLKISVDNNNQISETNETNNSLSIPFSFEREIPIKEWETLKTLFTTCGGETWLHKQGWMSNAPVSTWEGLRVNYGHVVELTNTFDAITDYHDGWGTGIVEHNYFQGSNFPENIENLTHLKVLDIAYSRLSNPSIPRSITKIRSLERLVFYECYMYGTIPENIGDLKNLEEFIVDGNNFTGELPSSLFELKKLKTLRVSGNPLLTGNIDSIGKLQNLTFIGLGFSKIGGKLPADVFNLPKLREIQAYNCLFNGVVTASSESTNEKLLVIDLSSNQLEGNIFENIINFQNLRNLNLSNNKFTGEIPDEISNFKDLFQFRISNNNFSGDLPIGIGGLKNMDWFDVSNNQLTGIIPSEIVGMSKARQLVFSNNKFEQLEPLIIDSLSEGLNHLSVINNKLEFQSFEDNLELLSKNIFSYSRQDSVGETIVAHISVGEDFNYQFSCSGSNNIYQWFHDGSVFGVPSNNGDLVLKNASNENFGKYVCKITNPLVDRLKLYSRPVYLSVGDYIISNDIESSISELMICPNPISSDIPLRISGLNNKWSTIKIINLNGQIVFHEALNQSEFIQTKEIDISQFEKSTYFIQFVNKEKSITKKFVII
jgi:Leucine-rich repeat (LRR) protein